MRNYLLLLRRNWLVLLIPAILVAAVMGARIYVRPVEYTSTSAVYVNAVTEDTADARAAIDAENYVKGQMSNYVAFLQLPAVTDRAASELDNRISPATLKDSTTGSVTSGTTVVRITVVTQDADLTMAAADAMAAALVETITDELSSSEAPGGVKVVAEQVEQATAPVSAEPQPLKKHIVFGFIAGLIIGLVLATGRELLGQSLRSKQSIELATDVPLLGSLPKESPKGSGNEGAETKLWTTVRFLLADADTHMCAVGAIGTASAAAVVSRDLAEGLAGAGFNVCLVDASTDKPALTTLLGMEGRDGLAEVLRNEQDLKKVLAEVDLERITALPAGLEGKTTLNLLASERMEHVLAELSKSFDYVLLSSAATPQSADELVLARLAGAALLAVDAKTATRDQLESSIADLATIKATLLGLVLVRP